MNALYQGISPECAHAAITHVATSHKCILALTVFPESSKQKSNKKEKRKMQRSPTVPALTRLLDADPSPAWPDGGRYTTTGNTFCFSHLPTICQLIFPLTACQWKPESDRVSKTANGKVRAPIPERLITWGVPRAQTVPTVPIPYRLMTPSRSRRVIYGSGAPSGKAHPGITLEDRISMQQVYLNPPKEPLYINDRTTGKVLVRQQVLEGPATSPKRNEFSRFAVARSRGGIFPRGPGGCVPYVP